MALKLSLKKKTINHIIVALVGLGLILGSFMLASAQFTGSPGSMLAAAVSAISGRPLITITRNANSPKGTLSPGKSQALATFDVRSKNVTNAATLRSSTVKVSIGGSAGKDLRLQDFNVNYKYCIPSGVTYGYGYPGGSCGTIKLPVSGDKYDGKGEYEITFSTPLPVYPVQSSGVITVSATPMYTVASKNARDTSHVSVSIKGTGSGDQCKKVTYGYKNRYGYSKCTAVVATVTSANGNRLTISRPYGYGYIGAKKK